MNQLNQIQDSNVYHLVLIKLNNKSIFLIYIFNIFSLSKTLYKVYSKFAFQ
jgi:hypothetical protein